MKRIKTDWSCTCRLGTDTLDMLMRVNVEGPKLADFDPKPIVNRWWGLLARGQSGPTLYCIRPQPVIVC